LKWLVEKEDPPETRMSVSDVERRVIGQEVATTNVVQDPVLVLPAGDPARILVHQADQGQGQSQDLDPQRGIERVLVVALQALVVEAHVRLRKLTTRAQLNPQEKTVQSLILEMVTRKKSRI